VFLHTRKINIFSTVFFFLYTYEHIHRCEHNIMAKFFMSIELYLLNQSSDRLTFFSKLFFFCLVFQFDYQDFQEIFKFCQKTAKKSLRCEHNKKQPKNFNHVVLLKTPFVHKCYASSFCDFKR
jgi:hypothetical protein